MSLNLELINALNTHQFVKVPVFSKEAKTLTQKDAVDYWMRNRKGMGWCILDIDVHTFANLFWEESTDKWGRNYLGSIKPESQPLNGLVSPHMMVIVETDKWTPPFIMELAKSQCHLPSSKLIVLERQGW